MKVAGGEKRPARKEEAKTAKFETRKPKFKTGVKGSRKPRGERQALRAGFAISRLELRTTKRARLIAERRVQPFEILRHARAACRWKILSATRGLMLRLEIVTSSAFRELRRFLNAVLLRLEIWREAIWREDSLETRVAISRGALRENRGAKIGDGDAEAARL